MRIVLTLKTTINLKLFLLFNLIIASTQTFDADPFNLYKYEKKQFDKIYNFSSLNLRPSINLNPSYNEVSIIYILCNYNIIINKA